LKSHKTLLFLLITASLWGCKPDHPQAAEKLLIWHSYEMGSIEETIFSTLIQNLENQHPGWEIESANIPFESIDEKYKTEVEAGKGPDLLIRRNDILGEMVDSGLIADLSFQTKGKLDSFTRQSISGMTVDGKLYGIPLTSQTDVLYFNRNLVSEAPRTMDDLLATLKNGSKMTMHLSAYHLFGWPGAFGGKLIDESGLCIADQRGWLEAANFLLAMKDSGVIFSENFTEIETPFLLGQTAYMINGPWVLEKYRNELGNYLDAIPLPAGLEPSTPLLEMVGIYINPNTRNINAATELGLFLTGQESQSIYMDYADQIPVRVDVKVHDPIIQAFVTADSIATVRPQENEFKNFWTPFNKMWVDILVNDVDPSIAITEACNGINTANNK
jgi:arabinogalactan oligomer/maltooligosaccharide transport system substrate-binding protein